MSPDAVAVAAQKIALKELNEPFIFVPGSVNSQEKLKKLPFAEAAIQTLFSSKNIVRTHSAHVSIVDPDTHEPLGVRFRDVIGNSVRRALTGRGGGALREAPPQGVAR